METALFRTLKDSLQVTVASSGHNDGIQPDKTLWVFTVLRAKHNVIWVKLWIARSSAHTKGYCSFLDREWDGNFVQIGAIRQLL